MDQPPIKGKFEIFKSKNQKNESNNPTFKLIRKISMKIPNLRFEAVRSYYCEQVKKDKIVVR